MIFVWLGFNNLLFQAFCWTRRPEKNSATWDLTQIMHILLPPAFVQPTRPEKDVHLISEQGRYSEPGGREEGRISAGCHPKPKGGFRLHLNFHSGRGCVEGELPKIRVAQGQEGRQTVSIFFPSKGTRPHFTFPFWVSIHPSAYFLSYTLDSFLYSFF